MTKTVRRTMAGALFRRRRMAMLWSRRMALLLPLLLLEESGLLSEL